MIFIVNSEGIVLILIEEVAKDNASAKAQAYDNIEDFRPSPSFLRMYEEKALRINICETSNMSKTFPGYSEVQIDPELEHLKLEGFDFDQILTFVSCKYENLGNNQRRFSTKL